MSVIHRDYLPPPAPAKLPPEIALMIIRKAEAMAQKYEQQCMDELTRSARKMLAAGVEPAEVAWQLKL